MLLSSAFPKLAFPLSLGLSLSLGFSASVWSWLEWVCKVPIIPLSPRLWWVAAGCWGEKRPAMMLAASSLSCSGFNFWNSLTRTLKCPEPVKKVTQLESWPPTCYKRKSENVKISDPWLPDLWEGKQFYWRRLESPTLISCSHLHDKYTKRLTSDHLRCLVGLGNLLES